MRIYIFKFVLFAVCIVLPINLFGQQVETKKEEPVNLQEIRKTLIFRSRQRESDEEINKRLITNIRQRKVSFILNTEDEDALKKAGGNDALFKTIRENLPKNIERKLIKLKDKENLYRLFTSNYAGTLKQKRIAIEAAKEYLRKYGEDNDDEDKVLIEYFKETLPFLEDSIKICGFNPRNPQ